MSMPSDYKLTTSQLLVLANKEQIGGRVTERPVVSACPPCYVVAERTADEIHANAKLLLNRVVAAVAGQTRLLGLAD